MLLKEPHQISLSSLYVVSPHHTHATRVTAIKCSFRGQHVTNGREEENNRSKKEGDGWRRKGVRAQQSSGRFQLVMEIGVAHPAPVVTDLTCPPDIHSQSSFHSALQLQAPSFCLSLLPFISLFKKTFIFALHFSRLYPISPRCSAFSYSTVLFLRAITLLHFLSSTIFALSDG